MVGGWVEKNAFPISRKKIFSPGDVNINLTVIPRDSRSVTLPPSWHLGFQVFVRRGGSGDRRHPPPCSLFSLA